MPAPVLDKVMRLAARHHAAGRLRQAAAIYRRVLDRDPHHAVSLHALGVMAFQTGRPDAAEKLLLRALAADAAFAPAHDDLGSLRLRQGRLDEALSCFRAAIQADPLHAMAHAHLGAVLVEKGELAEAVLAYQRAVSFGLTARRRRTVAIDGEPLHAGPNEPTAHPAVADEPSVLTVERSVANEPSHLELPLVHASPPDLAFQTDRSTEPELSVGPEPFVSLEMTHVDFSETPDEDSWAFAQPVESPADLGQEPADEEEEELVGMTLVTPVSRRQEEAFAALPSLPVDSHILAGAAWPPFVETPTFVDFPALSADWEPGADPPWMDPPVVDVPGLTTTNSDSIFDSWEPVNLDGLVDLSAFAPVVEAELGDPERDAPWAALLPGNGKLLSTNVAIAPAEAKQGDAKPSEPSRIERPAEPPPLPPAPLIQSLRPLTELRLAALTGRPSPSPRAIPTPAPLTPDPLVTTRNLAKEIRRARRIPGREAQEAVELHKEGTAHVRQRRLEEAITVLQRLVELHPASAKAHRDLGAAYLRADRLDEAIGLLMKALELRPRFGDAYASLGDVYHLQGKIDDAITCYRRALAIRPTADKTHSNLLLSLNYQRKLDPRALFAEHQRWAQVHARPHTSGIIPHANDASPDRPLRVGYISPDFRRHSVNYFIEPIVANHDRTNFHITCYSDVVRPDEVTERMKGLCQTWCDARGMTDDELALRVRADGIDLLIDLAGHTGTNRLGVFARKPAPVQVTYLGYPNTTGMDAIDYRLTDAIADPPGQTEALHSESLYRLPGCFLCYQPPEAPPPSKPPGQASGHITFGCFNVMAKVTPEVLSLWAKILLVLPDARLLMKDRLGTLTSPARRRYVHDIFAYHRVASDRLELIGKEPDYAKHLESYGKVDIMLDPFPYNGTTTTCEALWMGVPVITLAGTRHASRVGTSLLTAAGLTEFIAQTPEAYARAAVLLARDGERLAVLRRTMRQRLLASRLLDGKKFTAYLESAYREMWQHWCKRREAGSGIATNSLSLSDDE